MTMKRSTPPQPGRKISTFTAIIIGMIIGVLLTSPARLPKFSVKNFENDDDDDVDGDGDDDDVEHEDTLAQTDASSASSNNDPNLNIDAHKRIKTFREYAVSLRPVTDKVYEHSYHTMYGQFLMPFVGTKPDLKMFEIGLGCAMNYGAGASVGVWKKLFPHIELWEADIDQKCVDKWRDKDSMKGLNLLVGDQNNPETLDSWIEESGGKFDVIIDDGGHHNCLINTSFNKLWPELNPGGLYFVEDLQVGQRRKFKRHLDDHCDHTPVAFIIKDWMHQLIFARDDHKDINYKLPEGMISIYCQNEACVFQKKQDEIHEKVPFREEWLNAHE